MYRLSFRRTRSTFKKEKRRRVSMEALSQTFFFTGCFFLTCVKKKKTWFCQPIGLARIHRKWSVCRADTQRLTVAKAKTTLPHSCSAEKMHLCAVGATTHSFQKWKSCGVFNGYPTTIDSFGREKGGWENQHASSPTHLENSHTSSLMLHL